MPVPILIFGAATVVAFAFAPPSILITGPIIWLILRSHRARTRELRQAANARAAEKEWQARLAAARRL